MLEAKLFIIRNERLSGDISDNPLPLITNKYYPDVRERAGPGVMFPSTHSRLTRGGEKRRERRLYRVQSVAGNRLKSYLDVNQGINYFAIHQK